MAHRSSTAQTPSHRRATHSGVALLVLGPCILGIAGCGDGAEATAPSPHATYERDATAKAVVDATTGSIVLPIDAYFLTPTERTEIGNARALAMSLCAEQKGVTVPWEAKPPLQETSRRYGVWVMEEVQRFGYAVPDEIIPTAPPPDASGTIDDSLAVFEECNSSDPAVVALRYEQIRPGFDVSRLDGISAAALGTPDANEVFSEWETCLHAAGLQRDTSISPFAIQGATLDISEANVRIAVLDVQCKEQTNFVQRLADIEASIQGPIVTEHESELLEMRSEYEAVLDEARSFVATHA